jgi:4-amino-4-deoxy-L-arabinose transferase-like glycosyltransferase
MATSEIQRDVSGPPLTAGLGLAVILAFLGQVGLLNSAWPISYGLGLYLAGAVFFIVTLRKTEADLPRLSIPAAPSQPLSSAPRLALWLTSLALTLLTLQSVTVPLKTPQLGRAAVITWLLSIGAYSWSVLNVSGWRLPDRAAIRRWWQANWREVVAVAIISLLALLARTYDLELHPYSFVNDEGEIGKEALRILRGERQFLFDVAWASQPMMAYIPSALAVWLLGHTAFAVRLVSAVEGTLTVLCVYLLAREIFDRATGFLAMGALLAMSYHLHFSRLGVTNVIDAFTSVFTLWLVYRALRRDGLPDYLWSGLATGLALYTYLGSRLSIALTLGTLVYVCLRERGFARAHIRHLLVFAGAALVVAAPMALFFYRNPDHFMSRLNSEGILYNGFLAREAVATGKGTIGVLLDQFSRSTLVFLSQGAPGQFFNSPAPYLPAIGAIFLVLGMAYTLSRILEPRYMTLAAWFWSVVILGSTLTVGPPSSQRLLMTAPAVALLVGIGLRKTAAAAEQMGVLPSRLALTFCAAVATLISLQGVYFYFGEYRQGHFFEDASNEMSYESFHDTGSLGSDYSMYIIGYPRVFVAFANFDYLTPDLAKQDFNDVTPESIAALPRDRGAFFLTIPERRADLQNLAQWVPGGQWIQVYRRNQPNEMLYYAYRVPPGAMATRP